MKVLCTRLLLSVAFLALCLTIAAPARAHEDTSEMSRADLLLLQDTVARLWTLHVGIGEKQPGDKAPHETFGLVKDEQLSPAFVARLVLQLVDPDAGATEAPDTADPGAAAPETPDTQPSSGETQQPGDPGTGGGETAPAPDEGFVIVS